MANKAIFFDRDGTLNVDVNYLHRKEDFEWMPGAIEAIRYANETGFLVIVVTNQSGVARGFFPESDVTKLHDFMNDELKKHGAHIDAFYYCPHLPDGKIKKYAISCDCRKPRPGLIERAVKEHDIDRASSLLIGDGDRDIKSAESAHIKGVKYQGENLLELLKKYI